MADAGEFALTKAVTLSGTSSNTMTITVEAATIALTGSITTTGNSSDQVRLRPACSATGTTLTSCRVLLGGMSDPGSVFHLTDTELDTVSTAGKLYIGDIPSSTTDVDDVEIQGLSFTSGTAGVYISALYTTTSNSVT